MPVAKIEVRRARTAPEIQAFIAAVHDAQRDALRMSEGDHQVRYIEHAPERFAVPPGCSEDFTFVEIVMFPGTTLDAKRKLYSGIVRRFTHLGVSPADIFIVIHEPPLKNCVRGIPANEIDAGVDVQELDVQGLDVQGLDVQGLE